MKTLLLIWSEKPAKTSLSDIKTGQQCYSKKKFKNVELISYFSGFTSHQPCHANFMRIHCDFEETKPCHVENNTKTVNSGFLGNFLSRQF